MSTTISDNLLQFPNADGKDPITTSKNQIKPGNPDAAELFTNQVLPQVSTLKPGKP
jgi:hypothetical protein